MIWEVQLCSSVAPGGMLPISGCLWEAGDSPGFIWFLCDSGRNESILTITHWAFHFIQICSAALKLVSGCAREKQKNKNTYYKSRLESCTVPCKFRSLHLVKSYILKPSIPLSSWLLNIKDTGKKINLWCKSLGFKCIMQLNLWNGLVCYVLWMFIFPFTI